LDAEGNVYVAEPGNGAVEQIELPVAQLGTLAVGTPSSTVLVPFGFTSDTTLSTINVFTKGATGKDYTQAASGTTCATGTAYTAGESCVVAVTFTPKNPGQRLGAVVLSASTSATALLAGTGTGPLAAFSPGTVSTLAVSGGASFNYPNDVAVDGAGNVYVADTDNHLIRKVTPAGVVTTLAGSGTAGSANGTGTAASFNFPSGVAVDGAGNVYVADYSNYLIRKVAQTPPSLTFASTNDGSTSSDSPQTVTLSNIGNSALSFTVPTSGENPSVPAGFTLGSGTGACPQSTSGGSAATLASGAYCALSISFSPTTQIGTVSGDIVLTDNNLNASTPVTQSIPVSGTAINPLGIASQLVFNTPPQATIPAGGSPGTVVLSVEDANGNVETGSSASITLTVTGPNSYSQTYTVSATNGVATFSGLAALSAGGSYTYSATDSTDSLTATPATETVVQSLYTAPTTTVGSTGVTQTATVTFSSNVTLNSTLGTAIHVLTQGAPNQDFVYASGGTCAPGASYTAGQSCTVEYTFTPKYPGQRLGAVVLSTTAGTNVTALLAGTGTGAELAFSTTSSTGGFNPAVTQPVGSGFAGPIGMAVDASGNVYVADYASTNPKEILAGTGGAAAGTVNANSTVIPVGGTHGNSSVAIAVAQNGNVYFTVYNQQYIFEVLAGTGGAAPGSINASSTISQLTPSGLTYPQGLAIDSHGNVFVADAGTSHVNEIFADTDGSISSASTVISVGSGFNTPSSVAVDSNGNVYVSDYANNAIKEILAGTGGAAVGTVNSGSNVVTLASALHPQAVAVDASGNVYFPDGSGIVQEMLSGTGGAPAGTVNSSSTIVTLGSGFINTSDIGRAHVRTTVTASYLV
jgi:sugar lactone lactonase YvrE